MIKELRLEHPFPWRYLIGPGGQIAVTDAAGKEVPLLKLLDFTCAVTDSISKKEAA